jgi:hypothetical protein
MNRQVYDGVYRRVLEGKSSRTLWETILSPFEDVETRKSREAAEREALAERARRDGAAEPQPN